MNRSKVFCVFSYTIIILASSPLIAFIIDFPNPKRLHSKCDAYLAATKQEILAAALWHWYLLA